MAWLLSCLALAGCAPSARPVVPQPVTTPVAPAAGSEPALDDTQDVVPWLPSRPLTWDDFRGSAPLGGVEGARTVYLLSYEWRCRGIDFSFAVKAVVLPSRSWVKPHVLTTPTESRRVLRHEQTHFNLTESYARRMRRFFKGLYNPCGLVEERLRDMAERFVQDEGDAQRQYDEETGYGLKPQAQDRWDRDAVEALEQLAAFAQ